MTTETEFRTKKPHRAKGKDPKRDLWRTPPEIFAPLFDRFRFALDAAASASNCLVPIYIDEARDSLAIGWKSAGYDPIPEGSAAWLNPPYSATLAFLRKCVQEADEGLVVVALVPATVDVRWFHECVLGVASEVWYYTGRLAFVHPETGKPVSGNAAGSMLVVWTPEGPSWAGTRFGSLCHVRGTPVRPEDVAFWNSRLTSSDAVLLEVPTGRPSRPPSAEKVAAREAARAEKLATKEKEKAERTARKLAEREEKAKAKLAAREEKRSKRRSRPAATVAEESTPAVTIPT